MTGEIPTGPPAFGRWQQPAVLANAGLGQPEPYPLEKILFCATCDRQFFGAHQAGGVRVYCTACTAGPDRYSRAKSKSAPTPRPTPWRSALTRLPA